MSHNIKNFKNQTPAMDFQAYFTGPVKAWGMIQGPTGKINRRFTADLVGTWQGETGTLDEVFYFNDGEVMERAWEISRLSENTYSATADDIVGTAYGESAGNATNWNYTMNLPVGDKTYKVAFDDWMFLMEDGIVINKAKLKKFGLPVGEMTIFMKKGDTATGAQE